MAGDRTAEIVQSVRRQLSKQLVDLGVPTSEWPNMALAVIVDLAGQILRMAEADECDQ